MLSDNPHINIFIAYSHKDKAYLNELLPYLNSLQRTQSARIWYDGEIAPGAKWDEEIKTHLNEAHIILLLISVDALDSDYFHQEEMKRALERHEAETAIVIPVILRPCMWKDEKIGSLQALPEEGKPIVEWSLKDRAYNNVAKGIKDRILTIKNRKQNAVAILAAQKKEQEDKATRKAERQVAARQKEKEEQARKAATKQKEEQRRESIEKRKKQLFRLLRIGLPVLVGVLVVVGIGRMLSNDKGAFNFTGKVDTIEALIKDMMFVKGGTFEMGCTSEQSNCGSDEKPAHTVTVSNFNIGKYEVTQAQWEAVMDNNPSSFENCPNCPVESVSWNDVQQFISKLNKMTGKTFRLPTEAEWEYAARGGNQSKGYKYAGSDDIDKVAWYSSNSGRKTHKVSSKVANELGLYDMSGNVWEWCHDVYDKDYYKSSPQDNPKGPNSTDSAAFRVLRGGSWFRDSRYCRSSNRDGLHPEGWYSDVGFRLAETP